MHMQVSFEQELCNMGDLLASSFYYICQCLLKRRLDLLHRERLVKRILYIPYNNPEVHEQPHRKWAQHTFNLWSMVQSIQD